MGLLYDFLTSSEFRLQMEGIVEGFYADAIGFTKEKNAMSRIWKQREKQMIKSLTTLSECTLLSRVLRGMLFKAFRLWSWEDGDDDALALEVDS